MTRQFPDTVRYAGREYDITAVDGVGLFDPVAHGLTPTMLGTACWRGFICTYAVEQHRLLLVDLGIGLDGQPSPDLFGVTAQAGSDEDPYSSALWYRGLGEPIGFTGRLLVGYEEEDYYLNMGFWPAHLFRQVQELVFNQGRLTAEYDRSEAMAQVRRRLAERRMSPDDVPIDDDSVGAFVTGAFSLSYDYSWPRLD